MKYYFWAQALLMVIAMSTHSATQYAMMNSMQRETLVIGLGVISMFITISQMVLSNNTIKELVIKYRYQIVLAEGILGLTIGIGMVIYGITPESLVARWLLGNTVLEVLSILMKYISEKMKEERGDGSSVSVERDKWIAYGCTIGHVIAITMALTIKDLNADLLIYMHGFVMCIDNLGLWFWMRSHDNDFMNKPIPVEEKYMGDI